MESDFWRVYGDRFFSFGQPAPVDLLAVISALRLANPYASIVELSNVIPTQPIQPLWTWIDWVTFSGLMLYRDAMDKVRQRLGFAAYYGLEELVVLGDEFDAALADRIARCKQDRFQRIRTTPSDMVDYKFVRVADTFFSDTFAPSLLCDIVAAQAEYGLTYQFLLLDPFSSLARIRAKALESGRVMSRLFLRLNSGVRKILQSMDGVRNSSPIDDEFENRKTSGEYLGEQLTKLKASRLASEGHLELKFTSTLSDLPFYFVGPYVLKGSIFAFSSAANNPWSIYVDDPQQPNDMFGSLSNAFKVLWNTAKPSEEVVRDIETRKDTHRSVFLSHGRDLDAMRVVAEIINNTSFAPGEDFRAVNFEREYKDGDSTLVPDIWKGAFERSNAAVVLLLKEDLWDGRMRARQNVVHELGYAQAKFGASRVLIVVEEGVDFPSNLQGEMFLYFSREPEGTIKSSRLELKIKEFLQKIARDM